MATAVTPVLPSSAAHSVEPFQELARERYSLALAAYRVPCVTHHCSYPDLAGLARGTAGYAVLSRKFWRAQGATAYIVDGTAVTCLQDSVIICAKHEGIPPWF